MTSTIQAKGIILTPSPHAHYRKPSAVVAHDDAAAGQSSRFITANCHYVQLLKTCSHRVT